MQNLLLDSAYMGCFISLAAYFLGSWIKKKTRLEWLNPLLFAIVLVILFLKLTGIDFEEYRKGADMLQYFLTPATICLAVPLYRQWKLLKDNAGAILLSICVGSITSMAGVYFITRLTGMDHTFYVSMLPKSITTAIGISVSEELGGIIAITAAVIIVTGILGSMMANLVFSICNISDPVAQGVALGTSAHAIGTSKALRMGEVQGAMSSLSIVVAGIITVVLAPVAARL